MEFDQKRSMWSLRDVLVAFLLVVLARVSAAHPVLYLSVADGIMQTITCILSASPSQFQLYAGERKLTRTGRCRDRLVSDKEV